MPSEDDKRFKPGSCTKVFGGAGLSAGLFLEFAMFSNFAMSRPPVLAFAIIFCGIGSAVGVSTDYTGYKLRKFFNPPTNNTKDEIEKANSVKKSIK